MLIGRKILLGITGGIAAYKTAYIIRLLIKQKCEVKVVVTSSVKNFISHLTLATLSKNPVYYKFFEEDSGEWYSHVELADWADAFLIAPLTANTMAKMTCGQADNILLATYLSTSVPVIIAPAMDLNMFKHPATQKNLKELKQRGHHIISSPEGELASGLCGEGRMAEPEDIVHQLNKLLKK